MTGLTLKQQIKRFTSDEAWSDTNQETDLLLCDWVTAAINEFPPEAFTPVDYEYTDILTDTEYDLPEDFLTMSRILYDNVEYSKSDRVYVTATNTVIFPEPLDSLIIYYIPVPARYSSKSSEIPLRLQFHQCIYYYLLSMYYAQSGEGDSEETVMSNKFYNQYLNMRETLISKLCSGNSTDPVPTKDTLPKSKRRSRFPTLDEEGYQWRNI